MDPNTLIELRLGRVHRTVAEGHGHEAIVEVEELLDQHPNHSEGLFLAGQALLSVGNAIAARSALIQCLQSNRDNPAVHLALAMAAFECADFQRAQQAIDTACREIPDSAKAWFYKGLIAERMGCVDLAESAFATAHELDPDQICLPLDEEQTRWDEALQHALICLPLPFQVFYREVTFEWYAFPSIGDLCVEYPPLSPMSGALYQGKPPREEDPWQHLPTRVRLYTGNLKHHLIDLPTIEERITCALVNEALSWTGTAAENVLTD